MFWYDVILHVFTIKVSRNGLKYKHKLKMINIFYTIILVLLNISLWSQSKIPVTVEFSGIETTTGSLRMGLFRSQEAFDDEKPFEFFIVSKSELKNGIITQSFQLPEGEYGISVWDDANDNKKLDKTFIGIPKEGYGFGNYIHKAFSKPKYSEFKTKIERKNQKVKVIFRYF